jgi:hypothetical protein
MVEACRGAISSGRFSPGPVSEGAVRLTINVTGAQPEGDWGK